MIRRLTCASTMISGATHSPRLEVRRVPETAGTGLSSDGASLDLEALLEGLHGT